MDRITEFHGVLTHVDISFDLSVISTIIALIALFLSILSYLKDRKKDEIDYIPQLFMRSEKKLTLHPVFSDKSIANYVVGEEFNLNFINIGDRKIVDLKIKVEVVKDKNFNELYDFIKEINTEHIHWIGEYEYSFGGVIGSENPRNLEEDVLDGNSEIKMHVPGDFHLILTSFNLVQNESNIQSLERSIYLNIEISYNHVFSAERVILNKKLPIRLVFHEEVNNTLVRWDSILFDK